MEKAFGQTVSGALKLKGIDLSSAAGDGAKKRRKKEKKHKKQKGSAGQKRKREPEPPSDDSRSQGGMIGPKIFVGRGKMTAAGTIVTGIATKFTVELRAGDAIRLGLPTEGAYEKRDESESAAATVLSSSSAAAGGGGGSTEASGEVRVVKHVYSDTQLKIGSPFSQTQAEAVSYTCMTLPRKVETEADRQAKEKRRRLAEERASAGTYAGAGGHVLTFREKKAGTSHGTYRIVTKVLDGPMSREALLQMRSKQKSDRYCM